MFYVYILRTSSNTLYVGQTNNLERRMEEHKNKIKGAKYMRYFDSFTLVYNEQYKTRSETMKREIEIKNWTKERKEKLIKLNENII